MDSLWSTCERCSGKDVLLEAIQFCSECQCKLCRECLLNHNLNAAFLEHHLTDIGTLSVENFCTIHEGSILDFFCVVHDCLCCLSCKIEKHNSCQDVLPLEDAAKEVKHSVMFNDVYNAASNIRTTLNKAITSQNVNIDNLNADEAMITSHLASNKAKIIKRLDELEGISILEISLLKNGQMARTESHKNSLLQIKRPLKRISKKIDQVSKYGSQKQLFVLINKYKLEINDLETKLQNILPDLRNRRMIFKARQDIQCTITTLGSTRVKALPYKADYKLQKIHQIQVPSLVPQMPSKFKFERKIKINRSDDILITKMGITNDNRLLLCNNSETHLLVYSVNGDYLQNCELSGRSRDIAVIPGTETAVVTLPIDLAIQYVDIKTMEAGFRFSVPFGCRGVAIVNDKICVGGYSERGIIRILEMNGKRGKILRIREAGYITNLHPGPGDSVYYSDTECNTVGNITLEGEERFRYTSADLIGPTAITTDKKGNVYVACEGSNNIQRITSNGEFLDIILDKENYIYCPTDIIFSNDHGTLFVLNHVNNTTYVLVCSCS